MSVEIGDLKPDPALWHEDNGRKPWENRSISGWHLGDAAHRLVANSLQLRENRNGYRSEEKNMCVRSAEVANKQHLEGVKKIAKLEAECQRLRGLVRKKLPSPAALAQMKLEVENLGRDYGETRWTRNICSLSQNAISTPSFTSMSEDGNDNERSCAGSWATTLISELSHFKGKNIEKSNKAENENHLELMDDFLEMEKLASNDSNGAISGSDISNNMRSKMANQDTTVNPHFHSKEQPELDSLANHESNAELLVPDLQSDIDPLPLMKFQMQISKLFESKDADMKKILDDVRCVVQETQDSLHHHTMGCVFMESHCSDATCDRQVCFEGTEVTEEKEMSLSKPKIVPLIKNWSTAVQGTSPDGDVLSQKIQKFSAAFDKVINSKISLLDFVLDLCCVLIKAGELHFNVLGYKNNEAETNCSYCIDKVALPENKVVRDTSGDRYSNGCAHFSDSTSDPNIPNEGSFISTFESNATSWKCSLEEFEQLKLEKDNMVLDLESTKAQLQGTVQLLAEVKSQLASAQKLNSLAETQLKCMAKSYKSPETRAEELQTEVNLLRAKTENLDNELQEERRNHQDALAKFKDFSS
ncbi:unnamed protein product [Camellia sinensis]